MSKCESCIHKDACAAWIRHGETLYDDFEYFVGDCPYYSPNGVEEVVRCKECRFWTEGRHHTGRCKCLIDFHDAERYVTDAGHFCSYGERKTDG